MTIEIKFDPEKHQPWTIYRNKAYQLKITEFMITYRKKSLEVIYFGELLKFGETKSIKECDLYATKEELLKSL